MKNNQSRPGIKPSTGPHRVTLDNWLTCAPFEELLQMEIEHISEGKAVLSMPFLYDFSQGAGLLHGGALTGLADTAVAMACKSLLPPGTHFATLSLHSTFLAPVRQGRVTAHATVTREGDRSLRGEAVVVDEKKREVMRFSSLFKIARRQKSHQAQ
ncbi:PaaI family thioesterase [Desulfomarina sp.]